MQVDPSSSATAGRMAAAAVEKMKARHLFGSRAKHLAAAEAALDGFASLPAAEARPFKEVGSLLRAMGRDRDQEQREEIYLQGLSYTAEHSARLAAGSLSSLAALALASLPPESPEAVAPTALLELTRLRPEPLAAILTRDCSVAALEALARPEPDDPSGLAGQAGGSWLAQVSPSVRAEAQNFVMEQLAEQPGSLQEGARLVRELTSVKGSTPEMIRAGLAQLGQSADPLQAAAAVLDGAPQDLKPEIARLCESRLPPEWKQWSRAGHSDQAVVNAALAQAGSPPDAQGQLQAVSRVLAGQPAEAACGALLENLTRASQDPRLKQLEELAARVGLTRREALAGARDLLEQPKQSPAACLAGLVKSLDKSARRGQLGSKLLEALASDSQSASASFCAGVRDCLDKLSHASEWNCLQAALEMATNPLPANLGEAAAAFQPLLEQASEAGEYRAALAAALPCWTAVSKGPCELEMAGVLSRSCSRELYEFSTVRRGLRNAVRYLAEGKPAAGDRLAGFGAALLTQVNYWADATAMGRDLLEAMQREAARRNDPALAAAAGLLLEVDNLPSESEKNHQITMFKGLTWLANHKPSWSGLGSMVIEMCRETVGQNVDMAAGTLLANRVARDAGSPGLRHRGSFLASLGRMRAETQEERRKALFEGLARLEPSPGAAARELGRMAAESQKCFRQSTFDRLRVARLALREMEALCREQADPAQAAACRVMAEVAELPFQADSDRDLVAQAWLTAIGRDDCPERLDPGWMAWSLGDALAELSPSAREQAVPVFLNGLEASARAWGDERLIPQKIAQLRTRLAAAPADPGKLLQDFCRELGELRGDNFWLVQANQASSSQGVEERDEMVIVGGVSVRKASE